jgi:hypothetical protein
MLESLGKITSVQAHKMKTILPTVMYFAKERNPDHDEMSRVTETVDWRRTLWSHWCQQQGDRNIEKLDVMKDINDDYGKLIDDAFGNALKELDAVHATQCIADEMVLT